MTREQRQQLARKCAECPYTGKTISWADRCGEPTGKYSVERFRKREFSVCKLANLFLGEIEACPMPSLTEEEIEQRVEEFDNADDR